VARDPLETVLERLRSRGGRVTTARRTILQALLDAPDHVTADSLAESVQAAHPDIHLSTVYRTLDVLTELGVVDHAHLGHGPAVFHLTDDPHQHLVCRSCGRVIELPLSVLRPVQREVARDYGFELDAHFALAGRCADCR